MKYSSSIKTPPKPPSRPQASGDAIASRGLGRKPQRVQGRALPPAAQAAPPARSGVQGQSPAARRAGAGVQRAEPSVGRSVASCSRAVEAAPQYLVKFFVPRVRAP